jgi:hypothetical protein
MFRTLDKSCGIALMRGVGGGLINYGNLESVQIALTRRVRSTVGTYNELALRLLTSNVL